MSLPKPWITPLQGERHAGAFTFDGQRIFFPDLEEHREYDVLWQPTPEQATGEVVWREMHTGRQRRAMQDTLCQVCGNAIEGRPIPWLLPGVEVLVSRPRGRPFLTTTPPTCSDCAPTARTSCPVLRASPPMVLGVRHFRLWGFWGDYVDRASRKLRQGHLAMGHSELPMMMARHLVVEIFDYRIVKQP